MKKILLIFALGMFLISFASAFTQTTQFRQGIIEDNGELTDLGTINDVNVVGYVCANADCSEILGTLWGGQIKNTKSNMITLEYPYTLQSPYGYGVYFYKDGYISSKLHTRDYYKGDSMGEMQTAYLTKKRTCSFPVSNLKTSMNAVSTTISAEISHLGKNKAPKYTPTYPNVNREARVDVSFEVINENGDVIYRRTKLERLIPEEKKSVLFISSAFKGENRLVISTHLSNEPKCMNYEISKQEKLIEISKVVSPINNEKYYSSNIYLKISSDYFDYKYSLDGLSKTSFTPNTTLTGLSNGNHNLNVYFTGKQWEKTFGGANYEEAYSIIQTSDGGYVFAGKTRSYGAGLYDAYVVKINNNGEKEWNNTFGGVGKDYANSIIQTSDGYVLAGYTGSYGAGGDAYVVKIDNNGQEMWSKTFGGVGYEEANSIIQTSDGYVFAGYTTSYGAGSNDVYVVKIDNNGEKEWNNTFGGAGDEKAYSIIQTSDGYVLAGFTNSYGVGYYDAYVVKINNNGEKEWSKTFGGVSYDEANSIIQTSDGGYVLAGNTWSGGAGNQDAYVVKMNNYGQEMWSKTYGVGKHEEAKSIIQTSDGYVLAGYTISYGAGFFNAYVVKINNYGEKIWEKTFGGGGNDEAKSIIQTSDGYVLAGWTDSYGAGERDAYVVKLKEYSESIDFIVDATSSANYALPEVLENATQNNPENEIVKTPDKVVEENFIVEDESEDDVVEDESEVLRNNVEEDIVIEDESEDDVVVEDESEDDVVVENNEIVLVDNEIVLVEKDEDFTVSLMNLYLMIKNIVFGVVGF
jgi:hypothetical protein